MIQTEYKNAFCVFSRCVQVHVTLKNIEILSFKLKFNILKDSETTIPHKAILHLKCIDIQNYNKENISLYGKYLLLNLDDRGSTSNWYAYIDVFIVLYHYEFSYV